MGRSRTRPIRLSLSATRVRANSGGLIDFERGAGKRIAGCTGCTGCTGPKHGLVELELGLLRFLSDGAHFFYASLARLSNEKLTRAHRLAASEGYFYN